MNAVWSFLMACFSVGCFTLTSSPSFRAVRMSIKSNSICKKIGACMPILKSSKLNGMKMSQMPRSAHVFGLESQSCWSFWISRPLTKKLLEQLWQLVHQRISRMKQSRQKQCKSSSIWLSYKPIHSWMNKSKNWPQQSNPQKPHRTAPVRFFHNVASMVAHPWKNAPKRR